MKNTTIIALLFVGISLLISLLLPIVGEARKKRSMHEVFVDSLTERRTAPIVQIVGADEDSVLAAYRLTVSLEIVGTDKPEDCGVSYPAHIIDVSVENGVLRYALAKDFRRIPAEKVRLRFYDEQSAEPDETSAEPDNGAAVAAKPTQSEISVPSDTVFVARANGRVEKQGTMTDATGEYRAHIIVKTTAALTKVKTGGREDLYMGNVNLKRLHIERNGDVYMVGNCRIDSLHIAGNGLIDMGKAVVGHTDLVSVEGGYSINRLSHDSSSSQGSITISGSGDVTDIDADRFEHIDIVPKGGKELRVSLSARQKRIAIK